MSQTARAWGWVRRRRRLLPDSLCYNGVCDTSLIRRARVCQVATRSRPSSMKCLTVAIAMGASGHTQIRVIRRIRFGRIRDSMALAKGGGVAPAGPGAAGGVWTWESEGWFRGEQRRDPSPFWASSRVELSLERWGGGPERVVVGVSCAEALRLQQGK